MAEIGSPDRLVIESGVSITPFKSYGITNKIRTMNPGDSFFVEGDHDSLAIVRKAAQRLHYKVSMRKATENNIHGMRVWRRG